MGIQSIAGMASTMTKLMLICLLGSIMLVAANASPEVVKSSVSKLGESATPEEVEKERAEIEAAKKEALAKKSEKKDSLDEIHSEAKLRTAVKQTLVEEEKLYSFMSFNFRKGAEGKFSYTDYYIRHMNRNVMASTVNGPMDRQDATFKILHALCEPGQDKCPEQNTGSTGCISVESVNYPGYFLASSASDQSVGLHKADGSTGFALTASFCIQPGLADANAVSFELLGKTGKFMRHSGYSMFAC